MKKMIICLLALGFFIQGFAQDPVVLEEVFLITTNYKYLYNAGEFDQDPAVDKLQRQVAMYNVKDSDFYRDDYDKYYVSFFIPEGKILASYDQDGKILRTAEKFKNVMLPEDVTKAVMTRFPNWTIAKDVYLVNYFDEGETKKRYKLLLENGDERLRIKVDENGDFL